MANLPGVGNEPQKVPIILNEVECTVNNSIYKTRQVPILQLKPVLGDIADGIIGLAHFSNQVMQISYADEYIKTYDDISGTDISGYSRVPMRREHDRLFLRAFVQINDGLKIEGEFLLDLGAGGSFMLTSNVGYKYDLGKVVEKKIKYSTIAGGIGGKSDRYVIRAEKAGLGEFAFNQPIIDYSLDHGGALASKKYLGLIGNEILDRFDIMIDFKNNYLYLKPNDGIDDEFKLSRLGFSYVDRSETLGGWIVKGFYENCEALKKGMQPEDKIIMVDGVPVEKISHEEQVRFLKHKEQISIDYLRGEEKKQLNLALNFDKIAQL